MQEIYENIAILFHADFIFLLVLPFYQAYSILFYSIMFYLI